MKLFFNEVGPEIFLDSKLNLDWLLILTLLMALLCGDAFIFWESKSSDLERDLQRSVDKAMSCPNMEYMKKPVLAVTPKKFAQLIAVLKKKARKSPCARDSDVPFDIEDSQTWPFCALGECDKGRCRCLSSYVGARCEIYNKKCWLMYCSLTSCEPEHQSIFCKCDPKLYGEKVLTGDYWYDEGRSSTYRSPPPNWRDDPPSRTNSRLNTALVQKSGGTRLIPDRGYSPPMKEGAVQEASKGDQKMASGDGYPPSAMGGKRPLQSASHGTENRKQYPKTGMKSDRRPGQVSQAQKDKQIKYQEASKTNQKDETYAQGKPGSLGTKKEFGDNSYEFESSATNAEEETAEDIEEALDEAANAPNMLQIETFFIFCLTFSIFMHSYAAYFLS